MKVNRKEIQDEMINITFGTYLFTFLFAGIFFIIVENKGDAIGIFASGVLFWLGYLLIRFINKKQSTEFLNKLEMREYYAVQCQHKEER